MVNLNREDIERIVENVISNLSIEVMNGSFVSPNERCVKLKLNRRVISETFFDVKDKDEYEG